MFSRRRRVDSRTGLRFRPRADRLEDRALLSVVTITHATETDSRTVSIDYTIESGAVLTSLTVDVVRSPDATLDGGDVTIGSVVLSGDDVTPGTHTGVPLVLSTRAPGVDALAPDPGRPYVFATATGPDTVTTSASFRKYVIGLVSHGFEPPAPNNATPAWELAMAGSLTAAGYDAVIPFNWMAASSTPQPGLGVAAGMQAGNALIQAIQGAVPADGVADLHLIGHSRGSVVITTAAATVQAALATVPQAAGGYWRLSYMDPHPTHTANVVPFSAADNRIGRVALELANAFSAIAQDPFPLTVPSMVADAQTFYENSPAGSLLPLTEESVINPWGTFPPEGIVPTTGAATHFETLNLTTPGMSHSTVYQWFQQNVVPTLNTASPFVSGPVATPILATGQNLYAIEDVPAPHLAATFGDNNPLATAGSYTATIDWGDGSPPSSGTVLGLPLVGYGVIGLHSYTSSGTFATTITIRSATGAVTAVTGSAKVEGFAVQYADVPSGSAPLVVGTRSDTGATVRSFLAYDPGFTGGVSVATGDVNGDGVPDIVTAPGRGTRGIVKVFDGVTGQQIGQATPFGPKFRGGLRVAVGDVNADGLADIVVGAGRRVKLLGPDGSTRFQQAARGERFSGPRATSRLSAADVDGDFRADITAVHADGSTRTIATGRGIAEADLARRVRLLRHASVRQLIAQSSFAGMLPLIPKLRRRR